MSSTSTSTATLKSSYPVQIGIGPVIGIALLAVVVGMALASLVWFLLRRKRTAQRSVVDDDPQSSEETKTDCSEGAMQIPVLSNGPATTSNTIANDRISPHGAGHSDSDMVHMLDKSALLLEQFSSSLITELDAVNVTASVPYHLDLDLTTRKALQSPRALDLPEVSVKCGAVESFRLEVC